jgi:tetratricopeptide (TPR) repeat protein
MKRSVNIGFSVVFGAFAASSMLAQSVTQFAKANQDYAQGHFKEAIDGYEAVVRSGQRSANLFYDLGNAYFRTGRFGPAILNYERALVLDRHHPESQANLQIARDESRALELQPTWLEQYLEYANLNEFSIAAAVAFWVGAFGIILLMFPLRRRGRALALSIVSWSIFAVTVFAVYRIDSEMRKTAIVTDQKVQARLATADNAGRVLALPPGSEIKILSRRGDWIYAALPNNLRGWIPAKAAELIRL